MFEKFRQKRLDRQFDLQHRLKNCDVDHVVKTEWQETNVDWDWQVFEHPNYGLYCHDIVGKWCYHDEPSNLEKISSDIRFVIADGLSPAMKYRPTLNNPNGPFSHLLPPLCIYSTLGCKDKLHDVLLEFGLDNLHWQSDKDTEALHKNLKEKGISSKSY